MERNDIINILEDIQWDLRHNIEPSNPNFKNLDDEDTECMLSLIKDKLYYLNYTVEKIKDIFTEPEMEMFGIN